MEHFSVPLLLVYFFPLTCRPPFKPFLWGDTLPFPQEDRPSPFSSWPSILSGEHQQGLVFWGSASPLRTKDTLQCVLEEGRGAGYGYYNLVSASIHEQCRSLLFPECLFSLKANTPCYSNG